MGWLWAARNGQAMRYGMALGRHQGLDINWLLAGYWRAIGYLSAGYQIAICWLSAGYWLAIGWQLVGNRMAIDWLSASYQLYIG